MGSVFKRVKKTIKKVTKPISKVTKGIAKGIAKVAKSVMKGVAKINKKLGPLGSIALAIAMPYALSGLSTAIGTAGGTTWLMNSSNLFLRTGKTDQSGFDDDGFGNLILFDFIDGKKVTVDPTAGSINYNTGEIELQDFSPQDGEIRFTAIPDSFDVIATENTILQTAPDESSVDVIEKSEKAIIKNLNLSRSI